MSFLHLLSCLNCFSSSSAVLDDRNAVLSSRSCSVFSLSSSTTPARGLLLTPSTPPRFVASRLSIVTLADHKTRSPTTTTLSRSQWVCSFRFRECAAADLASQISPRWTASSNQIPTRRFRSLRTTRSASSTIVARTTTLARIVSGADLPLGVDNRGLFARLLTFLPRRRQERKQTRAVPRGAGQGVPRRMTRN